MKRQEVKLALKTHFDAAHSLPNHKGQCKQLHGHRWEVEITIRGKVNEKTGMLIDFKELKTKVGNIVDRFDHRHLNTMVQNPTAENLVQIIKRDLELSFAHRVEDNVYTNQIIRIEAVRLWESPDCMVEV